MKLVINIFICWLFIGFNVSSSGQNVSTNFTTNYVVAYGTIENLSLTIHPQVGYFKFNVDTVVTGNINTNVLNIFFLLKLITRA